MADKNFRPDLIVLDGRHLLWRTADAFKTLTAEVDGEEVATGGVYGFLGAAIRVWQKWRARVCVAWESEKDDNFRFKLFPDYKKREEGSEHDLRAEEMDAQQERIIELLTMLGVWQFRGVRCEADDVIGRLTTLSSTGKKVLVYSGDSDLRQLVNERVVIASAERGKEAVYDVAAVEAKHGVSPRLISSLKALAGDSSDKIPGVNGVGPVMAAQLLNHYGSLDAVLNAALSSAEDWPIAPRMLERVAHAEADVRLYHQLTKIKCACEYDPIRPARDRNEVLRLLKLYKFRSLLYGAAEMSALHAMGRAKV
jgi:DNA polymerase-1